MSPAFTARPAPWRVFTALLVVYLTWGTTYLAIHAGVATLPPGLFGGVRVALAGAILLAFLAAAGRTFRLPPVELFWSALVGSLLFIGGNGLITIAEKTVPSGVASVLVATTPLWLALLEAARPAGERLPAWGWAGLLLGLVGVAVLCADKLDPQRALRDPGALLALGSAFSWAVGSSIHRHRRSDAPQLTVAAYQMFLGGLGQAMIGAASGEVAELRAEDFTPTAVYAFFHLLVFGSLVGFVAYNWLLGNVSAALTGTYAYVNPMVALVAGWLIGGEPLTARVLGGMAIILAGVAFVRAAGRPTRVEIESSPTESDLVEMACCAEEKV